ncbi:protein RETARDED ROOT GROWTH, mitochondrial-like isoform X2 [Tasmannia lanceolata]|uniref:protein RETARDED ROOT GROWTH, mitochondrial-like isoform X2 n=1 Tax=Tasmannia lanceolata TaxID=3420 RepID=UPI00406310EA
MGRLKAWFILKHMIFPHTLLSPPHHRLPYFQLLNLRKSCTPSLNFSPLSKNYSANCFYGSDFICGGHEYGQKYVLVPPHEEEWIKYIPVKAYFLCTSIDLKRMEAENPYNVLLPTSHSLNYVTLEYCDYPPEITGMGVKLNWSYNRYMVVFQYGSVVLFNIVDHEVDGYLEIVRKHASGLLPETKKDDYAVVEKTLLVTWMQGGHDYIVLQNLDPDGMSIIGNILGQSIALDYFVQQVDIMIEELTDIYRCMESSGTFNMERKKLIQLVGKSNSILADMILKVGLLERSEIVWRNANYAQILEYLRDEYELKQRFENLDFKLKFVKHNIHFLQRVLQHRRSVFLQWCFILVPLAEKPISQISSLM